MYKRFTLDELRTVQNTFISNFYGILKKEYCMMPTDLFKKIFREGDEIYYMNRGDFTFRFQNINNEYILMDERQKIQVILDEQGKKDFNAMVKNFILKKEKIV